MQQVYDASNGVEAHMILHLLQQEGLNARVDGEYLQGGIGELQTMGLVRVMVADQDYQAAKQLIQQWEQANKPSDPVHTKGKTEVSSSRSLLGAVLTLLLGAALGFVVALILLA